MDSNAQTLPPEMFEAVVTAFAETLIRSYRERFSHLGHQVTVPTPPPPALPTPGEQSPWLRVADAATRAQCSRSTIYSEVQAGSLRAARVGGGRILRIRAEWVDEWLQGGAGQK